MYRDHRGAIGLIHLFFIMFAQTNGIDPANLSSGPILLDSGVDKEVSYFPILEVRSASAVDFRGVVQKAGCILLILLDSGVQLLLLVSGDVAVVIILVEVNDLTSVSRWSSTRSNSLVVSTTSFFRISGILRHQASVADSRVLLPLTKVNTSAVRILNVWGPLADALEYRALLWLDSAIELRVLILLLYEDAWRVSEYSTLTRLVDE